MTFDAGIDAIRASMGPERMSIEPQDRIGANRADVGIGLFAPSFGAGYYADCAISRIHPDEGMRPVVGCLLALVAGAIVVAAFP